MGESRDRIEVKQRRVLVVEGREDARFLQGILRPPENIQIVEMGGRDRLRDRLDVILQGARKIGGLQALGVVRDADDCAQSAFQSVHDAVQSRELTPPARHGEYSEGVVPAVGVFIAPDGDSPGSLESLCVRAVADVPEAGCAREYLRCVERAGNTNWNPAKRDKAFAYAYIATSADPERHLNVGAAQGTWNRDSPAFGQLRAFAERLRTVGGTPDAAPPT